MGQVKTTMNLPTKAGDQLRPTDRRPAPLFLAQWQAIWTRSQGRLGKLPKTGSVLAWLQTRETGLCFHDLSVKVKNSGFGFHASNNQCGELFLLPYLKPGHHNRACPERGSYPMPTAGSCF